MSTVHLTLISTSPISVRLTVLFLAFIFPWLTSLYLVCHAHLRSSIVPLHKAICCSQCTIGVFGRTWMNISIIAGIKMHQMARSCCLEWLITLLRYSRGLDVHCYQEMLQHSDTMTSWDESGWERETVLSPCSKGWNHCCSLSAPNLCWSSSETDSPFTRCVGKAHYEERLASVLAWMREQSELPTRVR